MSTVAPVDTLSCRVPSDWLNDISVCWYDWQTLLAGLSALGIGAATIWTIRRQIRQQQILHQRNRSSRFAVARAKTPLAAVEISDHAKRYLEACLELWPMVNARSRETYRFDGALFPSKAESILDALVENTDDTVLIDQVSALYSEHQVMTSRLKEVESPSQHTAAINDYVLQPLMMNAIAMNLLEFGRDGAKINRLSWSDVETTAKSNLKSEPIRSTILSHIAGKMERENPVPLALRRYNDR